MPKASKKCGWCNHAGSDHYDERGGVATLDESFGSHHCHLCDKERLVGERESAEAARKKQVAFWVVVGVFAAIIAGIFIQNAGEHDAAYNAGHAWAKQELAAGYGTQNPDDPDPCGDGRAVSFASAGYNFKPWLSGCEAASGN
jgi:hypothetical protein